MSTINLVEWPISQGEWLFTNGLGGAALGWTIRVTFRNLFET